MYRFITGLALVLVLTGSLPCWAAGYANIQEELTTILEVAQEQRDVGQLASAALARIANEHRQQPPNFDLAMSIILRANQEISSMSTLLYLYARADQCRIESEPFLDSLTKEIKRSIRNQQKSIAECVSWVDSLRDTIGDPGLQDVLLRHKPIMEKYLALLATLGHRL